MLFSSPSPLFDVRNSTVLLLKEKKEREREREKKKEKLPFVGIAN
jgi:hypothetical protein